MIGSLDEEADLSWYCNPSLIGKIIVVNQYGLQLFTTRYFTRFKF